MKMFVFPFLISAFAIGNLSQDLTPSEVPAAVTQSLETKFKEAQDIEWEMDRKYYEAEFEIKKIEYKALFDKTGKLLQYKVDIPDTSLPEAVNLAVQRSYSGYVIDDSEKMVKGSKTYYQIELDGKIIDKKILFTKDGKVEESLPYWN